MAKVRNYPSIDYHLLTSTVVVKNPSDFVGDVLGASEKTTKGILSSTVGKVLVIDEAYGLYSSSTGQSADIYKTAVIDTIVAEVQSVPGDDRCVLLLGYKEQMENMLHNANPGLERRFPITEAFHFEDFTIVELMQVLDLKLKQQGFSASKDALGCVTEMLKRAQNKPQFGNAGEVDILLNKAKQSHQQRCLKEGLKYNNQLEAKDFDADFGEPGVSIEEMFKDSVGQEELVRRLENMKMAVLNMRARELDPRSVIPWNYVFCGPPGQYHLTLYFKFTHKDQVLGKQPQREKWGRFIAISGFLQPKKFLKNQQVILWGNTWAILETRQKSCWRVHLEKSS